MKPQGILLGVLIGSFIWAGIIWAAYGAWSLTVSP
jgi:hypothetical protein